MTKATESPGLWRMMSVDTQGTHREAFADPSRIQVIRTYDSTLPSWPTDQALYVLDPDGKRQRFYDPSGILPQPIAGTLGKPGEDAT